MCMRHIVICALPRFTTFFHLISWKARFSYWTWNACCDFLYNFCLKHFFLNSNMNWAKYDRKCILVFVESTRYSYQILTTIEYSQQIFEKYSCISWKSDYWEPNRLMRTDGRTVRHDEAISRFSQFCERA